MMAGAEGHAGVHHDDLLARCRPVLLPCRGDDQAGDDGEGDEMPLPVAAPVLLGVFRDGQGRLRNLEHHRQFGEILLNLADDPAALPLLHVGLGQVDIEALPPVLLVDSDLDRRFGHPQQEIADRFDQHRIGADRQLEPQVLLLHPFLSALIHSILVIDTRFLQRLHSLFPFFKRYCGFRMTNACRTITIDCNEPPPLLL